MLVVVYKRRLHPQVARLPEEAAELEGLIYELRAALATFDKQDLPACHGLAYGQSGDSITGDHIAAAEEEVKQAVARSREALRLLAQ